jgi:CBS domain containing-hemolysin-like protein
MTLVLYLAVFLAFVLLILSLVENAITYLSRFELRVLLEKNEKPGSLLQRLVQDRREVLVPLQFSIQLTQITLAILGTYVVIGLGTPRPLLISFFVLSGCVLLLRQLVPKLIVHINPEKVFLLVVPLLEPVLRGLQWIGWPLLAPLSFMRRQNALREEAEEEAEPTVEEIQAFLDVGEEEGIIEEDDTELIQSVVEFGDTLVREVMTPRSEMVTISEHATLQQLKELIVASKHSRIPVYSGSPEQIIGVVSVRPLLAEYNAETANNPILPLVVPTKFTPESKPVKELLKELQSSGDYMAIVVNEYGEVAGLVTVEDLVEEIVGEIHDKDEQLRDDVVKESDHSYVLRAGISLADFEKLFQVDVGDSEFTTLSGWLVNKLGKVPQSGEVIEIQGLGIEILHADRRRIHSLRVRKLETAPKEMGR